MPLKRILRESRTGRKTFFYYRLAKEPSTRDPFMAATRTLARMEGPQWARIEDTSILCSPQKAKLDDNLAITVNFKLNGGYDGISPVTCGRKRMMSMMPGS